MFGFDPPVPDGELIDRVDISGAGAVLGSNNASAIFQLKELLHLSSIPNVDSIHRCKIETGIAKTHGENGDLDEN